MSALVTNSTLLTASGRDVAIDISLQGAPDEFIMAWPRAEDQILLKVDNDFVELGQRVGSASGSVTPGVVSVSGRVAAAQKPTVGVERDNVEGEFGRGRGGVWRAHELYHLTDTT